MENMESQVITIYSPKGGTGKTTLSIQMALALAKSHKKVLLLDIAQFGNVGTNLKINLKEVGLGNIISFFEFADTGDPVEQIKTVKESIQTYKDDPYEIDVIVSAQPLKMEELDAERVRKIIKIVKQIGYDYIIIDTSSEISLRNIEAMAQSQAILILCDQDVSTVWNVMLLKDILAGIDLVERVKLVITKESKFAGMTADEIQSETGLLIFWTLKEEKALRFYNNQHAGYCRRREKYALQVKAMMDFYLKKQLDEGR